MKHEARSSFFLLLSYYPTTNYHPQSDTFCHGTFGSNDSIPFIPLASDSKLESVVDAKVIILAQKRQEPTHRPNNRKMMMMMMMMSFPTTLLYIIFLCLFVSNSPMNIHRQLPPGPDSNRTIQNQSFPF
jgi:hypothetical protein